MNEFLKIILLKGVFSLSLLIAAIPMNAQEVDNQLWLNYALSIRPNTRWSYGGDVGLRGLVSNENWNQILIRPSVSYRFSQAFGVSGAVALFSTFNVDAANVNEFRIHQDFNLNWPDLNILRLFFRLRIEERWFFYQSDLLSNDFNIRVRYLVGAESADIKLFGPKRPIYLQFLLEGFKTLDSDEAAEVFINRTRTHFAFGHRISDNFRYEFHYIRQQSRRFVDNGLETSENIYRLRTFHRIRPKEKP